MNEPEKERILELISQGIIRPEEATPLLAALSEEPKAAPSASPTVPGVALATVASPAKSSTVHVQPEPLMEVQMQRADGSSYNIQVPPNLVPLFWNIAKVAIRESARTAAQETWSGFKHIVRRKTHEVGTSVKNSVTSFGARPDKPANNLAAGGHTHPQETRSVDDETRLEARRQLLQMVQNGRITATDAARLMQQIEAI
jgi:hypothetical protein